MATYQVRLNWLVNNNSVKNIVYFDIPVTGANPLLNFADGVRASVDTHLFTYLSNLTLLESLTLREMTGGGAFSFEQGFTAGAWQGGNTGTLYDQTSTLLVSFRANAPAPNRGRINIPGMSESYWESDGWDNAMRSAAEAMLIDWANGLTLPQGDATLYIVRPDYVANTWGLSNTIDSVLSRKQSGKLVSRRPS